MNFEYAGLTDPGLLRENNEDSVAFEPVQGVAVLADGMGGTTRVKSPARWP